MPYVLLQEYTYTISGQTGVVISRKTCQNPICKHETVCSRCEFYVLKSKFHVRTVPRSKLDVIRFNGVINRVLLVIQLVIYMLDKPDSIH